MSEKISPKTLAYELACELARTHEFCDTREDRVLFIYVDGAWRPDGEVFIERLVEAKLAEQATVHLKNEVVAHVRAQSRLLSRADFDDMPDKLPVANGVLDLSKNPPVLLPHGPDWLNTQKLSVAYDASAECPRILGFLGEVMRSDDVRAVIEFLGYTLYKSYPIHRAFMLTGMGRNGKSTVLRLIEEFLGKENVSHEPLDALIYHRFAPINLVGKLANLCGDLRKGELMETSTFKKATGQDPIMVEQKGSPRWPYYNYAKMAFSANQLPMVKDSSDAFWSRWRLIEFPNRFLAPGQVTGNAKPARDQDELIQELSQEFPGLLNESVRALKELLQRRDFTIGESAERLKTRWLRSADPLQTFLTERCELDPEAYVVKAQLYQGYVAFCKEIRAGPETETAFALRLKQEGLTTGRRTIGGSRPSTWEGVRLSAQLSRVSEVSEVAISRVDLTTIESRGEIQTPDTHDTPDTPVHAGRATGEAHASKCAFCNEAIERGQLTYLQGKSVHIRCVQDAGHL